MILIKTVAEVSPHMIDNFLLQPECVIHFEEIVDVSHHLVVSGKKIALSEEFLFHIRYYVMLWQVLGGG